ncbi:hypothetical protein K3712_000546 [Escherichia coli]|nr:hypothetical protein [Escherichia coli]
MNQFDYDQGQYLGTDLNYQDNQQNAQGQSLSPTPPANGGTISNDYSNDPRTAFDFKQQLRQANLDTQDAHDTTNKYVFKDGTSIKLVPDSRSDRAANAALQFGLSYFGTDGDQNKAIANATSNMIGAIQYHDSMVKRQDMLKTLEDKTDQFGNPLYNPLDLAKWRDTGDTKDLIQNQGKWLSDGNGWMHNELTGQSRQIPGWSESKQQQLHYLKNPDGTYTAVNPFTNKNFGTVGTSNGLGVNSLDNSGDDGTGDENNHGYKFENGQWVKPHFNSKGVQTGYDVAGAQLAKQLNENQAASKPGANEVQMNTDIKTVIDGLNHDNHTGSSFIGKERFLPDKIQDAYLDDADRPMYRALTRIEGNMQNQGIAAATEMGASGINTEAEAERYFKSMPRPDRSSRGALRQSLIDIQNYTQKWNEGKRAKAGVETKSSNSTAHLSDDELVKMYGG